MKDPIYNDDIMDVVWFFAVLDNECQIFQHQQRHVTSNYLNLELSMFEDDNMQMAMTAEGQENTHRYDFY